MNIEADKFYTENDIAEFFNVELTTVRSWRYKRLPPLYIKMNRAVRYLGQDIIDYINENRS